MFKNYLTIAFRNLKRHKLYSAINILGLAVGMACCFLILLFVMDELSYDQHHPNVGQLYRVIGETSAMTPPVLAPTIEAHLQGIDRVVRFIKEHRALVRSDAHRDYESRFYWADASVFEMFHLPLLKGDTRTALKEPNTVVVTEAVALKYFGNDNPLGQVLKLGRRSLKVTGVLETTPLRSHINPGFIASSQSLSGRMMTEWFFRAAYTYVSLDNEVDPLVLEAQFPAFLKSQGAHRFGLNLGLQRVSEIHLTSHLDSEAETNSNVQYLYIFGSISILILFIACINFVNLSTARSAYRAREVGARKMLGALRRQLIGQFLSESVVLSLIAFGLSVSLFELFLPVFNSLFHTTLSTSIFSRESLMLSGVGLAMLVGIVAGSYSAFFLSSFSPIQMIRDMMKPGSLNAGVRQGLVIVQFAISTALIVCTAIIYFQLDYIVEKNLGFDKDHVIEIANTRALNASRYEAFCNTLSTHANVQLVSTGNLPGKGGSKHVHDQRDGSTVLVYQYSVGYDYLKTMGIELVSGRTFSKNLATDKDALVVNQKFLEMRPDKEDNVIGVVKDFHALSLHQAIDPVMISLKPSRFNVLVRIGQGDVRETMAFLEQTWKDFRPDQPFVYTFLDDHIDRLYRSEQKLGRIFFAFAGVAIFVACLGLFGLAAFTAERRTKEIGIRKVVGASVSGIVMLLSKDFVKLILIANVIAWPVAYWAMRDWLANFAYRIDLGWEVFVLSSGLALLIALLTVGYQAWQAARSNPVDALRYE